MKRNLWLIIFIFKSVLSFSQTAFQATIDSLKREVAQSKEDSNRVKLLTALSKKWIRNNPDESLNYTNQILALSQKIKWNKGVANAYLLYGVLYRQKSMFDSSLNAYNQAGRLFVEINDSLSLARCYGNSANVYADKGEKTTSIEYYFKALKIYEAFDSKENVYTTLTNIGITYSDLGDDDKALKYYNKAVEVYKESGVNEGLGMLWGNIGLIYQHKKNDSLALSYFFKAKKQDELTEDDQDLAVVLGNIGNVYIQRQQFEEAIKYLLQAIEICKELEDINHLALNYEYLGKAYMALYKQGGTLQGVKKPRDMLVKAVDVLKRGIQLSMEIESPDALQNCYLEISDAYRLLGNDALAYENLKNYTNIHDSIYTVDNKLRIADMATQRQEDLKEKQIAINKVMEEKKKNERIYFSIGIGMMCIILLSVLISRRAIKKEKNISETLLLNILPAEVAEELKAKGNAEAQLIDEVTVLFTDFKGFTQLSEKLSPKELVADIHECFSAFDHIMQKHRVEKIKTIGDAYMAAGGLPIPNKSHAEDVVKAAIDIQQFMHQHKEAREKEGKLFFEIRIGVHTGPVVAGIVGVKKFAYDIWGDTVNTASRMESSGEAGKINISETTYALVKDQFNCTHRGKISAKGKGEIDMYFVN